MHIARPFRVFSTYLGLPIKVWGGSVNFALRTHASAVAPPLTRLARPCRPHSTDMIHVIGPVMHPSYK